MSTDSPARGHRHTRSAAIPTSPAASSHPRNPHHLNEYSHARNSRPDMNTYNSDQLSTPPRTPQRDRQPSSQVPSSSTLSGTGSKQKSRNKNRPKNVMTSPLTTRKDRNISPFPGAQSAGIPPSKPMSTPSAPAYAGATFHASPAPSALPIPSYYSKSVPDSPAPKGFKSVKGNALFSSPHVSTPIHESEREESPLDFIFRADREEKARAQSASVQSAGKAGPFPPPSNSPRNRLTPPAATSRTRPLQESANRRSGSGIFAMELDGERDPKTPYGPAFSTPYADRINAARNDTQRPSQQPNTGFSSTANSEAIKAYLFSNSPTVPVPRAEEGHSSISSPQLINDHNAGPLTNSGPRSARLPQRPNYNGYAYSPDLRQQQNNARNFGRSSGLRQEVTPLNTPTRSDGSIGISPVPLTPSQIYGHGSPSNTHPLAHSVNRNTPASTGFSSEIRSADKLSIEDHLRKALKLDSPGSSSVPTNAIGSQPAAAASVPNYVGGRAPPMNGMHNGVMGS